MKAQRGNRCTSTFGSTLSLTSALDAVSGQLHAPAALSPGKTRYPLYRKLGGPQCRSGQMRKISSSPPGFDLRTVQAVASHYTDWAIPTQNRNWCLITCSKLMHSLFIIFFFIFVSHSSTCFEPYCAHHQEGLLYIYSIWFFICHSS